MTDEGRLEGPADLLARLAAEGIRTVRDVLDRAETVRDLPDRSNHVLRAAGETIHVKREKRRRAPREAAGILAVARAGVAVAPLAFHGAARGVGSLTGTRDLAPARPLDDLLREGRWTREAAAAALVSVATATAALHRARLHHHDLYLNHVFARADAPGAPVVLIDLERTTSHHGVLGHAVVKDLAAVESSIPPGLWTCRERAGFLATYLRARRFPVRGLLGPLLRRVVAKAERIRAKAPGTPVGPAARP